jgi:hypothetical protein
MNIEIDNNKLSLKGKSDMFKIYDVLKKIYDMDDILIWKYISDYFKCERRCEFEKNVRLSMAMFPLSYGKL